MSDIHARIVEPNDTETYHICMIRGLGGGDWFCANGVGDRLSTADEAQKWYDQSTWSGGRYEMKIVSMNLPVALGQPEVSGE